MVSAKEDKSPAPVRPVKCWCTPKMAGCVAEEEKGGAGDDGRFFPAAEPRDQ
jgi:hypothetical protein